MRTLPVLHGDETGWKKDGSRWWLWCFCSSDFAYFHADPSRSGKVVRSLLGEDFTGVLVADFYGAYNCIKHIQRCLVHLQRSIHEEQAVAPEESGLDILKEGVRDLIKEGLKYKVEKDNLSDFGNRSEGGAKTYSIMMSVIETCRLRDINIFDFLEESFNSDSTKVSRLIRKLFHTNKK